MAGTLKKVVLRRFESTSEGTFGLINFHSYICFTLERPDLDNRPNISCIPSGLYRCTWCYSPKYKRNMYLVENVKGRNGIRFHSANLAEQLQGCIALGEKLGKLNGKKALLVSKPAIRKFEEALNGEPFELEITNA